MALLRVRHCRALVYCRRAPPRCPACGADMRAAGLGAAPVRVRSPFGNGHRRPRAFLVRASGESFLRGYDGHGDLHVGITNSQGVVYNFDEEGVHRAGSGWEECISIPLVQPDMWELLQHWDQLLEEFSLEEAWLPHRYEEQQHNCYTFALAFINRVRQARGRGALSKAEFTERFLLARTTEASRYLSLQRQLEHRDCYIVPLGQQEQRGAAGSHGQGRAEAPQLS